MFLIKHFVANGVHLGHKVDKWNPKTASFLLGIKNDIHIIDLEQSILALRRALNFVKKVCQNRGYIFLVPPEGGTPFIASALARSAGGRDVRNNLLVAPPSLCRKAAPQRAPRPARGRGARSMEGANGAAGGPSMEGGEQTDSRGPRRSSRSPLPLGGASRTAICADAGRLAPPSGRSEHNKEKRLFIPEALVIFGTGPGNRAIIKEAIKLQIPLVGVLDTDSNPSGVRFPVPGNVASYDAIDLYIKSLIEAVASNKKTQVRDVVASNLAAPVAEAPTGHRP